MEHGDMKKMMDFYAPKSKAAETTPRRSSFYDRSPD